MKTIFSLEDWQKCRLTLPLSCSIGFVPTMGNLHQGHLSLCQKSIDENDITVVSIFVNPTQFNQTADYTHYPRTLDQDLALLKSAGVDYCIVPTEAQLYPDGYRYRVDEVLNTLEREGSCRPGHFTGMLTIVMKLFQLVQPTVAYFGEKDYQQYELVKDMVKAFFMPIRIQACPTVREPSFLPYSSRNGRLNQAERILAEKFAYLFNQNLPLNALRAHLENYGIQIEYLEIKNNRRYAAIKIGEIRLIDNREEVHAPV